MLRSWKRPERHERRLGRATRCTRNEHQRDGRRASRPSVVRRRPAVLVAVDDRVDREHQRRRSPSPRRRRRAAGRRPRRARPAAAAARERRRATPIGTLTRKIQCQLSRSVRIAAEQHAEAAAAGRDEPEDAHRLRALGRLGEERHHQRERDRRGDRAAESLHGPRADRASTASSTSPHASDATVKSAIPARNRRRCAEEVAEPPAEQQEAAEREQVRVDDPGERGLREAEVLLDRGQRDVRRSSRRARSSGCRG